MQKLAVSWLLGCVLFCVLLLDFILLLQYNQQQCSVCVQLDPAVAVSLNSLQGDHHHDAQDIAAAAGGFNLVHRSTNKKGIYLEFLTN